MDPRAKKQLIPWQEKDKIGFFNALWKTIKQVLFRPGEFFDNLEIKDSYSEPFLFYFIAAVGTWIISILSLGLLMAAFSPKKPIFPAPIALFSFPLLIVLGLYIGSAILHLCVLLFGGKGGFKGTFNVLAYNAATNVFSIIPFIGGLISAVWAIVVGVIGFKRIHKLSTARAVFAYCGFPFAASAIIALLVAIAIPSLLRARMTANESAAMATVRTIATAMEDFRAGNDRYPADELELKYAKPPYLERSYDNQTIHGYNYSVGLDAKEGYRITAEPHGCYTTGIKIFKVSTGRELSQEDCRK